MRFGLREIVFVILLLSMIGASYFFVFEPRNQQIAQARAEIKEKLGKLAQLEAATVSMANLDEEIQELEGAIARLEEKLPGQREEQVILREVWELAAAHKLKPDSVRTDKIVRSADYAELPIKMKISGDFDGFYQFLLEVERLPRITRLPTMRLRKQDRAGEGQMEAEVVLSIFFEGERA